MVEIKPPEKVNGPTIKSGRYKWSFLTVSKMNGPVKIVKKIQWKSAFFLEIKRPLLCDLYWPFIETSTFISMDRQFLTCLTRLQYLNHSNVSPPIEITMFTASWSCYEFLIAWGISSIWVDSRTWDCLCSNQSGSILFLLKMNFLFQFKTEFLFLIFRNKNKISDPPR